MAGQIIVLPGVTAAATAGAPRTDMNAADYAAAKIPSLKHIVSARALVPLAGGGVSGRCRNTGALLSAKGANPTVLKVETVAGKKGLCQTLDGAAALGLPAGSLTNSYTYVMAIYLAAEDLALASPVNFLSGYDETNTYISYALRYYGAAASPRDYKFVSQGPAIINPEVRVTEATAGWKIVVLDYNNDSKVLSLSVNSATAFTTVLKTAAAQFTPQSFLEIGYHSSINRMTTSKVGDLFTFNNSLLNTELGPVQLNALVAALKMEYGIA